MLSPGDQVIVALSGGRDSMALLHLLTSLGPELPIAVSAAHYNHNLRGAESQRDETFVRDYCRNHNIPLAVDSGDVATYARTKGLGLEEAARELRYEFLLSLSPTAKIATAHNADDNLETLLMHLIRGTGLHGLGGIPPVRDRLIRPMLLVDRTQIDAYVAVHQIPYVDDSSNREDSFLRNRLRNHVLPLLRQENPGVSLAASRLSQELRQEDDYLSERTAEVLASCLTDNGLSVSALQCHPVPLQRRAIRKYLSCIPELSFRNVDDVYNLMASSNPSARLSLPGGHILCRVYDTLMLDPAVCSAPSPLWLSPGDTKPFGPWSLSLKRGPCPAELPAGTIALSLPGPLLIRSRLPGDRIRLSAGEKKLKKYLIDQKIPAHIRDTLPVAVFEDTIVALPPLTAAWPYGAKQGNDSLLLTVKELEDIK